jgi:hypothetical protein
MSQPRSSIARALLVIVALGGVLAPASTMGQLPAPAPPNPGRLRQAEQTRWEGDMRAIRKGQIEAEAARTVGLRNCKSDKACERQVMDAYHDQQRELANQKTLANAKHKETLLEIAEMERQWKEYQRANPAPRP